MRSCPSHEKFKEIPTVSYMIIKSACPIIFEFIIDSKLDDTLL